MFFCAFCKIFLLVDELFERHFLLSDCLAQVLLTAKLARNQLIHFSFGRLGSAPEAGEGLFGKSCTKAHLTHSLRILILSTLPVGGRRNLLQFLFHAFNRSIKIIGLELSLKNYFFLHDYDTLAKV